MKIKRLAVIGGATVALSVAAAGTALAQGDGLYSTVTTQTCSAARYLDHYNGSSHQYTYFVIIRNGGGNIECIFDLTQNGNWATSTPGVQIYDGPGYLDQLCVTAFNTATNRSTHACDTPY